jgi:hypothetical protein
LNLKFLVIAMIFSFILFLGLSLDGIPKIDDSTLINIERDFPLIESWFEGKKVRLERIYRAT